VSAHRRRIASALAFASAVAVSRAHADDTSGSARTGQRFEKRGVRRAGIALFTAGVSALPSSLALYLTTDGRRSLDAIGMVATGHALMAAGIPMWVVGAQGRRTRPRNAALMYSGITLAGLGLAALPPSSAMFAASLDDGVSEEAATRRRTAAFAAGAAANALIVIGIPMWAVGAASPDDALAVCVSPAVALAPGGVAVRF
jgi:hypothetical protein